MNSNNIEQSVVKLETPLSFGSVCSGIEAASVAWEPLGWRASWFAEIEPFPSAVLAYHWPQVTNLGDMTKIRERVTSGEVSAPDVLVGGTPCQAFSVAGARKSLSDDRGQLTLEYVRLLNEIDAARSIRGEQPAIAVWENVPGVLNTKDNAFGCLLGALAGEECELQPSGKKWGNAGCVFGPQRAVAWRVLDAQYFGVAQRRRRVFVIASAREGFNPAEVLFEFDGVRRDSAPSRETGQDSTAGVGVGFAESSFGQYRECATDSGTLKRSGGVLAGGSETFIVGTLDTQCGYEKAAFQSVEAGHIVVHGTQDPLTNNAAFPLGQENVVLFEPRSADGVPRIPSDQTLCPTLNTMSGGQREPCIAYGIPGNWIGRKPENGGNATEPMIDIAPCQTKTDKHAVRIGVLGGLHPNAAVDENLCPTITQAMGMGGGHVPVTNGLSTGMVRRLTPVECERLQGFPDNHTQIPYRNKPAEQCPDGPRYAACGNSMAVPVMNWIGRRIQDVIMQISL